MGLESDEAQVEDLFMKNEIIGDEIHGQSKYGVRSATSSIMICLQVHE